MNDEKWLYPITMRTIADQHSLNLVPLMAFGKHISLPACAASGTDDIQIDVVAAEHSSRTLVIAECKNFVTFQGVSDSAEQLTLKSYLLKTYLAGTFGDAGQHAINVEALADYQLIQYVSLGRQGSGYANAATRSDSESTRRIEMYRRYLDTIGRSELGILVFRDAQSAAVVHRAKARKWIDGACAINKGLTANGIGYVPSGTSATVGRI